MFKATIAISVFYRTDECLPLVFESILKDPIDSKSLQLIICDDCSPCGRESIENVVAKYSDKFGSIILLRNEERSGFRKTSLLKKAIDQSDSEILVFFDGDCVFSGCVLSAMIHAAENEIALCQGQRCFLNSESISWANANPVSDFSILKDKFFVDNTKTRKNKKRHRMSTKAQAHGVSGRYEFASGYLMSIKTYLAKEIGMHESQHRGYTEDTDFAERLFRQKGIDLFEVQGTEILHLFEHH